MTATAQSRFDNISLHDPGNRVSATPRDARQSLPLDRVKREWVYGYRIKNKNYRQYSEKVGLDWKTQTFGVMCRYTDWIARASKVDFGLRAVIHRGKTAVVVAFNKDCSRRAPDVVKATDAQIDKVCELMGLPKGRQPQWYEVSGKTDGEGAELSSEDEEFPEEDEVPDKLSPFVEEWGVGPAHLEDD